MNQLPQWTKYALPALVLVLAIAMRFASLDSQMAHTDDVGVAYTIVLQDEVYQPEMIRNRIHNTYHEQYNSFVFRYLRDLDEAGTLESQLPVLRQLFKFIVIPQTWTYAPFQYLFTSLLVSKDQTYEQILFWGRLPSAVFGMMALLLLIPFFRQFVRSPVVPLVAALVFMGLSWENILYAAHMSSYAVGVLGAVITCIALVRAVRNPLSWKLAISTSLLLALAFYMSYQLLFFMPAFFACWVFSQWNAIKTRWTALLKPVLAGGILVAAFLPAHVLFLSTRTERGTIWAYGYPKYRFDLGHVEGIGGTLSYCLEFFGDNTYRAFRFVTALVPMENPLFAVFGFVFLGLFLLGMVVMFRSDQSHQRWFAWFTSGIIFTFLALAAMDKTTFAPTRHSLILLPLFAISMAVGVGWLFDRIKAAASWSPEWVFVPATLLVIGLFCSTIGPVASARADFYSEQFMAETIAQYRPKYILSRNENPALMAALKDWELIVPYTSNRKPMLFVNPDPANANDMVLGFNLDLQSGLEIHKLPYDYSTNEVVLTERTNRTFDISNEAFVITNFMVLTTCR